jgi:D-proline reductase (dithiol) PrdB
LHLRSDSPFGAGGAPTDYRVIPGDVASSDLVMSHLSVNFDRSGFQEDWNVVFPLGSLRSLAEEGVIGSVAAFHYSFMGAVSPVTRYEPRARELAALLKNDHVDAVLLSPV